VGLCSRRRTRGTGVAIAGIVVAALLAGCQSTPGKYTYVDARAASHSATTTALEGLPTTRKVLSDAHITCPSDSGFFASSFTWRTVTSVAVAAGGAAAIGHRVVASMTSIGWRASAARDGITTLTPSTKGATPAHVARILTDIEPNALVVTVFSSCYGG
jgi:hypothetical protein